MLETFKDASPLVRDFYWIIKPIVLAALWYFADIAADKLTLRFHKAATARIRQRLNDDAVRRAAIQRGVTLYQLLTQIIRGILAVIMVFWILDSVGIDMRPVIAGVGVVGLALSLAAQNIIRDYLNGFMILFEDQFNVGDFISAGGFSGTVELFSFRSTKLRDINGNLITIPNSSIQVVQNSNKDWSAAVVDIGIAYEADYKKALEVAADIAKKMASDLTNNIIEQPAVQGIVSFENNAVMLRVIFKTDPGQQWLLGRTYRQLIKDAYDKQGIPLAYPRLTVSVGGKAEKQEPEAVANQATNKTLSL